MVSIDSVERGMAAYLDNELLTKIDTSGIKGFGLGMAATLLIKRGGRLLREYAKMPILKQLGLVSQDGSVDLEALQEAAVSRIPQGGLPIDLPMGICLRVSEADVSALCEYIRREASL